jgi:FixJ family two-component response regulator
MTSATNTGSDPLSLDDALVIVVDDDAMVRESLGSLFRSVERRAVLLESASELLAFKFPDVPCCLVLDVRLRGPSGLDLQAKLTQMGVRMPIIFVTGYGDIPMTVAAMKAGAEHFLSKPFRDQDLLDAVAVALEKDAQRRAQTQRDDALRHCFDTLTPRETEVMALAASGLLNKQIADRMSISEVTVKIHRGQAMRKMRARTFAELVLMAGRLGLNPTEPWART